MADFSFVTTRLATGGALSSHDDVQALVAVGVTHVIDCRREFDDAQLFIQNDRIHYLWNGTDDDGQPKSPRWFSKSIVFALDALSHRHNRVYAHCAAGVNRGPSTCYAIMRALGFPPSLAEGTIRACRPQVNIAYIPDANAAIDKLGYA